MDAVALPVAVVAKVDSRGCALIERHIDCGSSQGDGCTECDESGGELHDVLGEIAGADWAGRVKLMSMR